MINVCKEQVVNGIVTKLRLGVIQPIPERIQAALSFYAFIRKEEAISMTELILKRYNEEKSRI